MFYLVNCSLVHDMTSLVISPIFSPF